MSLCFIAVCFMLDFVADFLNGTMHPVTLAALVASRYFVRSSSVARGRSRMTFANDAVPCAAANEQSSYQAFVVVVFSGTPCTDSATCCQLETGKKLLPWTVGLVHRVEQ